MMWKPLANLHAIAVVHRRFPNFGLSSRSLWRRHGFTWTSQQATGLWSHFPRCSPALRAYFPLAGSSIAENFRHLLPVVAIKHLIHCDSRPAILLQDAALLLPKVEWKSVGQQKSHFCFWLQEMEILPDLCWGVMLSCTSASRLLKNWKGQRKSCGKKPCKIASSGGVFHHFVLIFEWNNCAKDWG